LIFVIGLILSLCLLVFNFKLGLYIYSVYFLIAFISALNSTVDVIASILCIPVIIIQFFGYGIGFFKSTLKLKLSNKPESLLFPKLFFKIT
jgi:hypothetical protein